MQYLLSYSCCNLEEGLGSQTTNVLRKYSASNVYISEIRLKFKGLAYVHWTEQHSTGSGKNRRTTTRHYSATENYFDQTVAVYGRGQQFHLTLCIFRNKVDL